MTKYHYGLLAGFIGGAFAFWQLRRAHNAGAPPDRGTVIFSNTPQTTEP